jgi:vacuolar protein sorting-associated protein VTA1
MEKGLVIPPKDRTKMTNSILVSLINQLEKVPPPTPLPPSPFANLNYV